MSRNPSTQSPVPPHAPEAEMAVLGAVMLDNQVLLSVREAIEANDFYSPANQKIYAKMIDLDSEGTAIDLVTMQEALRTSGELDQVGGVIYLSELLDLAYKDPCVGMIVVDRLIQRKAFHIPETLDPNPQLIDFLKKEGYQKPTVITVDSGGGDLDLASKGTALRATFCKAKIPAYPSLQRAAKALAYLHRYYSHFVRS